MQFFYATSRTFQAPAASAQDPFDRDVAQAFVVKEWTATAKTGRAPPGGGQHRVVGAEGRGSGRIGWAKNSDAWSPHGGGQMHRARIVGDQEIEALEQCRQRSQIQIGPKHGQFMFGLGNNLCGQVGLARPGYHQRL